TDTLACAGWFKARPACAPTRKDQGGIYLRWIETAKTVLSEATEIENIGGEAGSPSRQHQGGTSLRWIDTAKAV
ncbi:MAG: hypothetical protein ACXVK3_17775, partial [Candidatus Angelobacter sp.]